MAYGQLFDEVAVSFSRVLFALLEHRADRHKTLSHPGFVICI